MPEWTSIALVIVAVLSLAGTIYAASRTREGSHEANEIDRFEANIQAFEKRAVAAEERAKEADDRAAKAEETAKALSERVDALEQKEKVRELRERAYANTLRSAADQWPKDHPGPVFDERDIEAIDDTFPKVWRIRPPDPPGLRDIP